MPTLTLDRRGEFDDGMDRLRVECFPEEGWEGSARDRFDTISTHLVFRSRGDPVAYLRLTPGRHGYFRAKLDPAAVLPDPAAAADLGRACVRPDHRGLALFELLMLDGLLLAAEDGYAAVVGAARPGRRFLGMLDELGFAESGPPVPAKKHRHVCPLQPLVAATAGRVPGWRVRKAQLVEQLRGQGYEVIDGGSGGVRDD